MPQHDYYLPQRKLVSQNDSAIIERANVPRSKYLNRWSRKTAFNASYLVPILVEDIMPGDHMTYDVTAYIRMSTPLFPIFDNQRVDTFFFFVPSRLVWSNWQRFMGEQNTPGETIDIAQPTVSLNAGGMATGSLYDHMGVPGVGQIDPGESLLLCALPFRCYNLIYWHWFRDQNTMTSPPPIPTDSGPDTNTWYVLLKRNKSHDYFTSALPWPQKFTSPVIPVSGVAPVTGIGFIDTGVTTDANVDVLETDLTNPTYALGVRTSNATQAYIKASGAGPTYPSVYADLSQATGVSINTFRQAFMIQSLLERDARGGTRYIETVFSHFGVRNPDYRMQRPEYIGGGQTPLVITPIAQTAPTAGVPLGALGAAGTAAGSHRASYAATEHGYIIGLINIRTELSYQQGLPKLFRQRTRYDYPWPSLTQMGEQAIRREELYVTGVPANDTVTFGYQERYHEFRTRQSEVTGIMRSFVTSNIDEWHLAQLFAAAPTLSTAFIEDDAVNILDRNLAAGTTARTLNQQYLADIEFRRTAVRPIPAYGTPANLGRF